MTADAAPEQEVTLSRDLREAALQFAVAKGLADAGNTALKALKADAAEVFMPRDSIPVPSPYDRGQHLGLVSMTNPKPVAVIDPDYSGEFAAWVEDNYPDQVEHQQHIRVGVTAEVVAVLAEHAPHLLTPPKLAVKDWARDNILKRSAGAGEPIGPGGEVGDNAPPGVTITTPDGVIQVRLADDALPTIGRMLAEGRTTFGPALPVGPGQ